jgi:hypothetical protein
MALPKQVEQQMKEIEEMERALTVQPEDATPETPQEQPVAEVVQAKAEPESNVVELKPQPEDWEQKYKSLQGHFDREVPRLHTQNKELAQQLQELKSQIDSLSKPQQKTEVERLVTDKDEEAFGADLIDVQRRVAKEVMREYVTPLQAELKQRDDRIAQLESVLTRTQGDVTSMTFEQKLDRAIPDFAQINTDPKWIAWLDGVDSLTGEPRRAYAEYVYNQGNLDKVTQIVNLYKQQAGTTVKQAEQDQRQAELRKQVQPNRSASSTSTPNTGERVYTSAEADRLWDKVALLNRKGNYDEAKTLEADLSNAMVQGRIRP